jgi:plastocyanin
MTDLSPRPSVPERPAGRARPRGGSALVAVALLTAVTSAALLVHSRTADTTSQAVSHSAPVLDVTQAAAYAATSANTIEIKSYAFAPAAATVPVGTTVTWVNEDSVPHTVTSKAGPASFDSGQLGSGASWSATFATPGVYDYYCVDHPQMVARITVTAPGDGGTPTPTNTSTTKPPTSAPPSSTSGTTSASGTPTSKPTTKPSTSAPSSTGTSTMPTTPTTPSSTPSTPGGSSPATSSSGMSMPPPGGSAGAGCGAVNQVLGMLVQHIDSAHLKESPGQQVQDLTNLNQYVLSHTTLVANLLTPLVNGATGATDGALSMLIAHVNATHLGESPGQQVQDLLNLDQYVLSHTTLVANMLGPAEGVLTGNC